LLQCFCLNRPFVIDFRTVMQGYLSQHPLDYWIASAARVSQFRDFGVWMKASSWLTLAPIPKALPMDFVATFNTSPRDGFSISSVFPSPATDTLGALSVPEIFMGSTILNALSPFALPRIINEICSPFRTMRPSPRPTETPVSMAS